MLKWLSKKRNQKGFTLIELIVVIAILGILAAIAIPRFGGFTDKAKKAADEQYGAIVGNSTLVLLASGDITKTEAGKDMVVEITRTGAVAADGATPATPATSSYKLTNIGKLDATGFKTAIEGLVNGHDPEYYKTSITVTIDSDDVIKVTGVK